MNQPLLTGQCLCGAVTYTLSAKPEKASICHCGQCRRQSGHLWGSAEVADGDLSISGETLTWYESSPQARRGFCNACGSYLFWQWKGEGTTSFSLGSLNDTSDIVLEKHIFVADKGDYYTIKDGLPQEQQ